MRLGADRPLCRVELIRGNSLIRDNNHVFCQGLPACRPTVAEVIKRAAVSDRLRHRRAFVWNAKLSSAGGVQALPNPLAFSRSLAPVSGVTLLGAEVLVAALFALIITAYGNRPRGWCDHSLVQVASSEVAGKGVFAVQWIPKGTAIGAYPGVPRKADSMLRKASLAPNSRRYVFQSTSQVWLDPTDQAGLLSPKLGLPLLSPSCDVSMAYMNEPPVGCAVNVEIVDGADSLDLRFVTTCDIHAGTELFLDYGKSYDRSAYRHVRTSLTKKASVSLSYKL